MVPSIPIHVTDDGIVSVVTAEPENALEAIPQTVCPFHVSGIDTVLEEPLYPVMHTPERKSDAVKLLSRAPARNGREEKNTMAANRRISRNRFISAPSFLNCDKLWKWLLLFLIISYLIVG